VVALQPTRRPRDVQAQDVEVQVQVDVDPEAAGVDPYRPAN
jgi:hypothetical protein